MVKSRRPLPPQRLPLRNQLRPKNLNVEAWDLHGPRGRHNSGMKYCALLIAVLATLLMGCDNESPTTPSPNAATVRFTYLAATALNPDLPASTQACVQGVGRTHIHPSWRNFTRIDMQAVGSDRWEISFGDVAVNERQAIRISDPNVCTDNPTGAATNNVFANDVRLVEIVPTPGTGTEPGLAFTVGADGRVSP